MGVDSKIEWTDHTFNPWRGCTKVSPGCANCYAEKLSKRNPKVLGIWGDRGTRVIASEAYWRLPRKWNAAAKRSLERHRVFCASMADVFEDRPELDRPRARLLGLIQSTPNLDWLLLTKRPDGVIPALGRAWNVSPTVPGPPIGSMVAQWLDGRPPQNVWLGTSIEDQQRADERIPELLSIPAAVRFLSVEPLLGPVDLTLDGLSCLPCRVCVDQHPDYETNVIECRKCDSTGIGDEWGIDWVIVGGESGPKARPMHPQWARDIRDQCVAAGVAFHFKQWGTWFPLRDSHDYSDPRDFTDMPADGQGRFGSGGHLFALTHNGIRRLFRRCNKKTAGRVLDGREWHEFPHTRKESECWS